MKEDDIIVMWLVRYTVNKNLIGWSGATKREKIENIEKMHQLITLIILNNGNDNF